MAPTPTGALLRGLPQAVATWCPGSSTTGLRPTTSRDLIHRWRGTSRGAKQPGAAVAVALAADSMTWRPWPQTRCLLQQPHRDQESRATQSGWRGLPFTSPLHGSALPLRSATRSRAGRRIGPLSPVPPHDTSCSIRRRVPPRWHGGGCARRSCGPRAPLGPGAQARDEQADSQAHE